MRSHTSRSRAWFLRIQDSNAAPVRKVFSDAATTEAMMRTDPEDTKALVDRVDAGGELTNGGRRGLAPRGWSSLRCASSLNGLKTLSPGRLKSRSFPVAMVSP